MAIIGTVGNLFDLTFRMDLSPPLSPWPWHLCLLLSHTHLPPSPHPPFSFSPCLIGTGLVSQWRCVQIQLVCVMLCCLILLSDSHSGQESSWTCMHAHMDTRTHLDRTKVFPETHYSFNTLTYCLYLTENRARWGHGVGGYALLFHPGVLSKHLRIAFTVMTSGTFPFPSNQKTLQD